MSRTGLLSRLAAYVVVKVLHLQLGSVANQLLRAGWMLLIGALIVAGWRIHRDTAGDLTALWQHWPSILLAGFGVFSLYFGYQFRRMVDALADVVSKAALNVVGTTDPGSDPRDDRDA